MSSVPVAPERRAAWRRWLNRLSPLQRVSLALPFFVLAGALIGQAAGLLFPASAWLGAAVGAAVAAVTLLLAVSVAFQAMRQAPRALARSGDAALRDPLSGAMPQSLFVAVADREWARVRRYDEDAAVLMVDPDHLHALNEAQGTGCGDAVLAELARLAGATLRPYDLLARFGGGVLVAYLPHTDPIGALDAAERIRERVAGWRMTWNAQSIAVTVSVGVASVGPDHGGLDAVIADAGGALREAKEAGRNCVRAAPIQPRRNGENRPVISK